MLEQIWEGASTNLLRVVLPAQHVLSEYPRCEEPCGGCSPPCVHCPEVIFVGIPV